MWEKKAFYRLVSQACDMVPGFENGYRKFERQVVLKGLSEGLLTNYGRNVAQLSLHFGRRPELVSIEEINCYLYHKAADEQVCESYIRHTVCGLRMWLRIQRLLGHNQIRTTITYLHIARVLPKTAKSPLDTLYNFHPS